MIPSDRWLHYYMAQLVMAMTLYQRCSDMALRYAMKSHLENYLVPLERELAPRVQKQAVILEFKREAV